MPRMIKLAWWEENAEIIGVMILYKNENCCHVSCQPPFGFHGIKWNNNWALFSCPPLYNGYDCWPTWRASRAAQHGHVYQIGRLLAATLLLIRVKTLGCNLKLGKLSSFGLRYFYRHCRMSQWCGCEPSTQPKKCTSIGWSREVACWLRYLFPASRQFCKIPKSSTEWFAWHVMAISDQKKFSAALQEGPPQLFITSSNYGNIMKLH